MDAARAYGSRLTVVALGPLTNIAQAIRLDARAMRGVRRIVVMGGTMLEPGNVTPAAEFNIYVDPHAADEVLGAGSVTLPVLRQRVGRWIEGERQAFARQR